MIFKYLLYSSFSCHLKSTFYPWGEEAPLKQSVMFWSNQWLIKGCVPDTEYRPLKTHTSSMPWWNLPPLRIAQVVSFCLVSPGHSLIGVRKVPQDQISLDIVTLRPTSAVVSSEAEYLSQPGIIRKLNICWRIECIFRCAEDRKM